MSIRRTLRHLFTPPWAARRSFPRGVLAEVEAAIAELPDDLRESVLLYDYADQSHEEIAAALGITHDAARKRHSRALVALGRALKERLA